MERGLRDERLRDRLMQTFTGRERPARRRLLRRAAAAPKPPRRAQAAAPMRAEADDGPARDVA